MSQQAMPRKKDEGASERVGEKLVRIGGLNVGGCGCRTTVRAVVGGGDGGSDARCSADGDGFQGMVVEAGLVGQGAIE